MDAFGVWRETATPSSLASICSLAEIVPSTDYHTWNTVHDASNYSRSMMPYVEHGPLLCIIVLIAWTLNICKITKISLDFVVNAPKNGQRHEGVCARLAPAALHHRQSAIAARRVGVYLGLRAGWHLHVPALCRCEVASYDNPRQRPRSQCGGAHVHHGDRRTDVCDGGTSAGARHHHQFGAHHH